MKKQVLAILVASLCICANLAGCANNSYSEQWAMDNQGQVVDRFAGVKHVDINIKDCWEEIAAISDIPVIGIIDEGVDFSNGYLSKSKSSKNSVSTVSEHGTNVASMITTNHAYGEIKGCLNNAPLLQYAYNNLSNDSIEQVIAGIDFLESNGVRVVNCSFTISKFNTALYERMASSNMLFVCAAGDIRGDLPLYPAFYDLENVICVGGITNHGTFSTLSHMSEYVDIVAPGEQILTVGQQEELKYVSGTSIATPFITAACALISYYDKGASASDIKEVLLELARNDILARYYITNVRLVDFNAIVQYYKK